MTVVGREAFGPVTIALGHDHEIVHRGLARMLEPYAHLVRLVGAGHRADVTLVDPEIDPDARYLARALDDPRAGIVVMFGWRLDVRLVSQALARGAGGFLAKSLHAEELVEALREIRAGEVIVAGADGEAWEQFRASMELTGLTPREVEVVGLITSGATNAEIAAQLFVSINSVKSYIRSAYRKMGVTSRAKAVLWGVEHGMLHEVAPLREAD